MQEQESKLDNFQTFSRDVKAKIAAEDKERLRLREERQIAAAHKKYQKRKKKNKISSKSRKRNRC